MKLFFTIIVSNLFLFSSNGQIMSKPSTYEISQLPHWAQYMYSENPNVFIADSLYSEYYETTSFEKSYHTQYYKRWRRAVNDKIDENGFVRQFTATELAAIQSEYLSKQLAEKSSNWTLVGPYHNVSEGGGMGSGQANIYSLDQCASQMNMLYIGTEPGEVYKSADAGLTWTNSSMNQNFGSGVSAIEVHPTNPDIVFAGGNLGVFRSTDGGSSWTNVLPQTNFGVNEILINSGNTQIILAATDKGLYRSTDGGDNWIQLFNQKSYDIKENTGNTNTIYLLKNNPVLIICEFYISYDAGLTWNIQSNGWYSSNDPARNDGGGRIAVTPANPNYVYAYLIGEAKADDYGYIGVYKSTDGGVTWTLPNGPAGGPYTSTHLNLAYGYPDWTYHQGFYNCAITVSDTDPERILVGGLNLYRSENGGSTFTPVAGYVGGPLNIHVDMQDFRTINGTTWVTTDGGVYFSTDFFTTQPEFRMDGVHGSDFWGFGSGWNEDVLVGGLYHNGNLAYYENYGDGIFLELGGGEAPTGYVNPGENRKTYFSDISGKYIPLYINDPILNFSNAMTPNESYWSAESSEMEFHPNCYSIAFIGNENKLWKTTDSGGSYSLVKEFSTNVNSRVHQIEISSSNPNLMYVSQRPSSGSTGFLWKTVDGGTIWTQLPLPSGNSSRILISLNPANDNELWIAYPSGSNGNKVFHSINGGANWTNITSSTLNNESIHSIAHIAGTDGGLYVGTNNAIYYRNSTTNWTIDNSGLPTYNNTNILRPFYRDGKIRMASYGKGIWQSALTEQPTFSIARINVDKLEQTVVCEIDSFYFEDHSFLNHELASWSWEFPTGTPATSTERNPAVLFTDGGQHLAILTITDANGLTDMDSVYVSVNNFDAQPFVQEDFEEEFLPYGWYQEAESNGGQWTQSDDAGGFGTSTNSTLFDNYNYDATGDFADLIIPINSNGSSILELSFDVAYSEYGGQYSDTLSVMVSTDCGESFTQVFIKGGGTLGTAPNSQDFFTPTSDQWRTEEIDLSSYTGHDMLLVAFRNTGHWGNVIYLDNINISNNLGIAEINATEPSIYPNPLIAGENLYIKNVEQGAKIKVVNMKGKVVNQTILTDSFIQLPSQLKPGVYMINIETDTKKWNKMIVIQ